MPFPIRSTRQVYKIELIKVDNDDTPEVIDRTAAATQPETQRVIYVKMKVAIAEWLGLTPLAHNSPEFTGTFQGNGLNKGLKYRRKIGGFRVASYTLIATDFFTVSEQVVNLETGQVSRPLKRLKTMTIGFPKGHSVTEIVNFLASTGKLPDIKAVRAPSGAITYLGARFDPEVGPPVTSNP